MNDFLCSQEHCSAPLEPVVFAEARQRFEREAEHGVCPTGRYRMPYFQWGNGPPLVFIHGVSDSSRSFLQPISLLARHFRCIAYDLPTGRGDGARLGRYTQQGLVDDLLALLEHLRLERAYLFASSFGSTVALSALHDHPARLPRAILQGGLAHRPLRRVERFLARLACYLPGRMAHVPLRQRVLLKTQYPFFINRAPEVWEWFLNTSGQVPIRAVGHQALWLERVDVRPLLPTIRQPILLVCGQWDRVVPWSNSSVLHQGLANAGLAWIEQAGHVLSYSHPEALAEVTRRFLTPQPDCASGCPLAH
jgi:pimeloyl-ACP methyl ester carboxylesterase